MHLSVMPVAFCIQLLNLINIIFSYREIKSKSHGFNNSYKDIRISRIEEYYRNLQRNKFNFTLNRVNPFLSMH